MPCDNQLMGAQKRTVTILFSLGESLNHENAKKGNKDKEGNDIPLTNLYDYSDTLEEFCKTDRLLENELNMLICYNEFKLESPLNSFADRQLNDHLYSIFGTKHRETIAFMCTWTGFFVQQYRTKITTHIQLYLNSKKLTLNDWLLSVKEG